MKKLLKLLSVSLVAILTAVMLIACAPADLDKAEEKMEKLDYIVEAQEIEDNEDGIVGMILIREDGLSLNMLYAVLFDSSKSAKDYFDEKNGEDEDNVWLEGKWILSGDEDIYEDFMS